MNHRKIIITISAIAIVALIGGTYWYLSKKEILPTLSELFPGEAGTAPSQTKEPTPTEEEPSFVEEPGAPLRRLYELHKTPVAGVGFFEIKDKKGVVTNVSARYVENGLGHIFETNLSTNFKSRIVNETRPHISEALWGNGGRGVVLRFVDEKNSEVIKSRIINIDSPSISFENGDSTENLSREFLKTEEVYLPNYIPFMATSEDGADELFYLENGSSSAGSISTFKYLGISKIFSSAFTEWLPQFPNQKLVTLTTKPSASVPGYLYFIDTKTKSVVKIIGGINGLTTLTSHDGKFVLFSETKKNEIELSVYNIELKESRQLSLKTLPEKCAWGHKNQSVAYCAIPRNIVPAEYPDQWYQGLIAFSDDLWEINTATLSKRKIMSPVNFDVQSLDIINPTLSSDDSRLLFINKLTGTPWVYNIVEPVPQPKIAAPATISTATPSAIVPPSIITPDMQKLR